jgi:hypothetical protein
MIWRSVLRCVFPYRLAVQSETWNTAGESLKAATNGAASTALTHGRVAEIRSSFVLFKPDQADGDILAGTHVLPRL